MRTTRILRARRSEARAGRDEQGSLLLAMLLIMFMSIVILTVTTTAFGQLSLSNGATARTGSLEAALAGVQSAVGEIRTATVSGDVDPNELPCSAVSGVTNGTATTTYTASIQYYEKTPSGSTAQVNCVTGSGPQVASGDFLDDAVITSCSPSNVCPTTGAEPADASWRRVVSTYTFQTSNIDIAGGLIYDYGESDCLLAQQNSGTWQLYATTACSTGNPNYQDELFQYTTNWNLAIDLADVEYCVVDPGVNAASAVTLSPCNGHYTTASYQWGINDSGDIQDVTSSGGNPGNYLLDDPIGGQTPSSGGTLTSAITTVSASTSGGFSDDWSWQFSPTAGSGGAAPSSGRTFGPSDQLVNYEQFGLCMDVTNQNVNWTYLIDYDCKQFPNTGTYPTWNQRFCFDQITTVTSNGVSNVPEGLLYTPQGSTSCSGGTPYCVRSPLVASNGTSNDSNWVTVTSSSCVLNQSVGYYGHTGILWLDWGSLGNDSYDFTYTDQRGLCMEADTVNTQSPGGGASFATIEVATCDGDYAEKWNAPATYGGSQVSNTHEGTGDSWTSGNP